MGSPSISAMFGKTPQDAVAFFEAKGYQITFDWRDMWQDAHARAFTVTSVARLDVLEDIRGALQKCIEEGRSEAWFQKTLAPTLKEKGWWGTRVDVDPDGTAKKVSMGSPSRLSLIYRQNVATAYSAGRWKQQLENADNQPWLEYVSLLLPTTRDSHAALHGQVYRIDDPFWQTFYPPNDWGCKCRAVGRSQTSIDRDGITPESSEGRMFERTLETVNRDTGEVVERKVKFITLPSGRSVTTGTGFNYNPGSAAFGTDMEVARKLSCVQDQKLYAQVVQTLNNSPLRQERFAREVANVLESRRADNTSFAVGFVDRDIADFVRKKGHEPSTILVLPQKTITHADRVQHHRHGIHLTIKEWQALPKMIARPEKVLWDTWHGSVVYVYPCADPGRCIIIPAQMPGTGKAAKRAGGLDAIVNAFTTDRQSLGDIKHYEEIRGAGAFPQALPKR